jgi:hypothetical protein
MKYPWIQFFTGDWLKDPALSICSPATRGIWIDLLCAMHELDRAGELRGTPEQLARVARCQPVEITHALTELQTTGAAQVTERNGVVTLVNRRMKKEANERNGNALRQQRFKQKRSGNASVAAHKPEVRSHISESETEREPEGAHAFAEIPSWPEFWEYCQSLQCGLPAEWYAKDKWESANTENWKRMTNWRAYARRCKGWWESDGRPMVPTSKGGKQMKPDHEKGF